MGVKFFRKERELKKYKIGNKGSSLILVILAIAFIGMLVAMVSYGAYYNYLMKYSDRTSKDSFYTAETALEEINAGLQREISDAMAEAYTAVLQDNPANGSALTEKSEKFSSLYKEKILKKLQTTPVTAPVQYNLKKIKGYLDKTRFDDATGVGATLLTQQPDALIDFTSSSIILKGIKIRYIDEKGYVSMISTDIRVMFPAVNFVTDREVPRIENYSIIAKENLVADNLTLTEILGNVYGGRKGIVVTDYSQLIFGGDPTNPTAIYDIVAASVNARNSDGNCITIAENCELWTEDINVTTAGFTSLGAAYVRDDLTIDGRNSRVKLAGKYFGYGDALTTAQDSSSILVNGPGTRLDFSELTDLGLHGRAYIGVRHYDISDTIADDYIEDVDTEKEDSSNESNTDEKDPYANEDDIMLGQSLAVKTDQLMYLVPLECMGYQIDENKAIIEQELAKNPLSLAEYEKLTKTTIPGKQYADGTNCLRYDVVRTDVITEKLGRPLSTYSATYQPVFRRVNGTILVYYYLCFNSESMANRFFVDYYNADKENMDKYIKQYIASFRWNHTLNTRGLNLAGNLVYFDGSNNVVLKTDTMDADISESEQILESKNMWNDKYMALSAKLLLSLDSITSGELDKTVYDNIVNVEDFHKYAKTGKQEYKDETDKVKAVIVDNKNSGTFEITSANSELALVIASGDVKVSAYEFSGLILSGGTIEIASSCKYISYNPAEVKKALSLNYVENTPSGPVTRYAADVLIDSEAYITYISSGSGGTVGGTDEAEAAAKSAMKADTVKVSDLIQYENWSKE